MSIPLGLIVRRSYLCRGSLLTSIYSILLGESLNGYLAAQKQMSNAQKTEDTKKYVGAIIKTLYYW